MGDLRALVHFATRPPDMRKSCDEENESGVGSESGSTGAPGTSAGPNEFADRAPGDLCRKLIELPVVADMKGFVLAIVATLIGATAGWFLRPPTAEADAPATQPTVIDERALSESQEQQARLREADDCSFS